MRDAGCRQRGEIEENAAGERGGERRMTEGASNCATWIEGGRSST